MIDLLEMGLVSYRGDLQYDHSDDYGHKYSAIRNRVKLHVTYGIGIQALFVASGTYVTLN